MSCEFEMESILGGAVKDFCGEEAQVAICKCKAVGGSVDLALTVSRRNTLYSCDTYVREGEI